MGFDDETTDSLGRLFPTWKKINSLTEVQPLEYDLLITRVERVTAPSHLFLVTMGSHFLPMPEVTDFPTTHKLATASLQQGVRTMAKEFLVPEDSPDGVPELVRSDLIPLMLSNEENWGFDVFYGSSPITEGVWPLQNRGLRSFVSSTEPVVLAGRFRRSLDQAECWFLPEGADPVAWVRAAVVDWQKLDAERFPVSSNWEHGKRWRTPVEAAADEALEKALSDLREERARAEDEIHRLEVDFARIQMEVDAGPRRLLTAQGEDLVEAATEAFAAFGFEVENMDQVFPANDRREDLRVRTADRSWVALVEVRGYTKGAALSDLLRIASRFVPRFQQDEGRLPDSAWYVVNHRLGTDAEVRPRVLAGNDAEVEVFGEAAAPGLVVDSRTLFDLWVSLAGDSVTAEEVRRLMMEATGVLDLNELSG